VNAAFWALQDQDIACLPTQLSTKFFGNSAAPSPAFALLHAHASLPISGPEPPSLASLRAVRLPSRSATLRDDLRATTTDSVAMQISRSLG
jgi:hypothetical protein